MIRFFVKFVLQNYKIYKIQQITLQNDHHISQRCHKNLGYPVKQEPTEVTFSVNAFGFLAISVTILMS